MRKLVGSTFVTLDGVISDPQLWGPPYWDEEHAAYAASLLEPADAMLLGRRTYEGFAEAWPKRSGDPFTDKINAMPKHVASRTLTETTWNATVIPGDLVEGVRALKAEEGANLVKYGTGEVDVALMDAGLLDELHLWVFPVVAGSGERLLPGIDLRHLRLTGTSAFRSGIVVHVLDPRG
ncbi:MAG TPA: dihydrofolate reductase family protein [Miltoncostaeaceae bacterium]|jgi:dihydrofolate reductase|nr:dihydrofolate reductase family protein [Miltoncostaeaceae bacterium]